MVHHVAITGASAGIGAQLALAYADVGIRLSLSARNAERLSEIGRRCLAKGADVETHVLDVTDAEAVHSWVMMVESRQPIDLMIANAGIFDGHGPNGMLETADEARRLVEINLIGAINTAQAAMRPMRARRQGQIAVVSSLAALLPAADAPAYSASKAGVLAYCEAIRLLLSPDNIVVSVVLPGHVDTRQTEIHEGSLAMIVPAEKAAMIIKSGLARKRTYIAFPRTAHWLVRLARLLPWRVRGWVTAGDRFHVRKDQL